MLVGNVTRRRKQSGWHVWIHQHNDGSKCHWQLPRLPNQEHKMRTTVHRLVWWWFVCFRYHGRGGPTGDDWDGTPLHLDWSLRLCVRSERWDQRHPARPIREESMIQTNNAYSAVSSKRRCRLGDELGRMSLTPPPPLAGTCWGREDRTGNQCKGWGGCWRCGSIYWCLSIILR